MIATSFVAAALLLASTAAGEEPVERARAAPKAAPENQSGPPTAKYFQLDAGFRYGVRLGGEPNPWKTGLGVELGYTLPSAVYLGGAFEYFLGGSVESSGGSVSSRVWQLFAEAGYDWGLGGGFVLRPKLGLGLASVHSESDAWRTSEMHALLVPGVKLLVVGEPLSVSFDLRYAELLAGSGSRGLIFGLGVGF